MGTLEERPLKQDSVPAKKSLREKIKYVKDNITIEPALACYVIPGALTRLATQNLNLDKACRVNLNYGDEVCDSLIARESNKYLKQELAVQELVASMEDESSDVCGFLKSFFDIKHVKDTLVVAFRNGPNNRRLKSSMILVCVVLVHGASYVPIVEILNATTFTSLRSMASKLVTSEESERPFNCKGIGNDAERDDRGCYEKTRRQLQNKNILTLLVVALAYGPNHGEAKVLYLFLRYRLNWDALKYSIYSTESIIIHSLGALFTISVFSKRLGWDDSVLCLISIVSKLIGSIYIIFVRTDFHMYMVPIVEILNATTFTSLRSMASKLVPSAEMAGSLGNIVVTSNKIKLKRE
ncbi:hypothetical protein MSG28_007413 [Choristoneura fumiferana]|uniref:Uncharacterized protein n=1 Tax=Choristoneura fumiferana TaxID=7141 RepID=A0ACC0JXL6_CHOFU|nr:hypothetical protein MSG28_007413 [Choristoneura fumiferana]